MNEHELSKLLHEAADNAGVSPTAPRRVLRRTRLRMATTGAVALSLVALLAGGTFALATRQPPAPQPHLQPVGPVVTPGPQENFDSFTGEDEVILAEEVGAGSTWAFTVEKGVCLYSKTYTEEVTEGRGVRMFDFGAESGIGDCEPLGVPNSRDMGFYMWDSDKNDRLEVLGAVSTDVARLELKGSNASDGVVTIIKAPDELGDQRNFFYLWLPMEEVGTLVAYDEAGNVLEESDLCFEPSAQDVSCTVGDESSVSGSDRAGLTADISGMACDEISHGRVGRLFAETTLEQAIGRWIDDLDLDLAPREFEVERVDSDTAVMKLPAPKVGDAVSAILSKKGDHQWSIIELFYCEGIVDPDSSKLPKGLPPPPKPPNGQPPPPKPPSSP